MFHYVVVVIAFLLFFHEPLLEYFSASSSNPQRIVRSPRPPINESLLAIDAANVSTPNCPPDSYSIHILSRAPTVIYMENFISLIERSDLLEISEPIFEPSTITNDGTSTQHDVSIRDSDVALLPRDGNSDTVRCLERRALAFQGWRGDLWIERLRTQRYGVNQHYAHHFDWGSGARGWGRVSSFMVWVSADGVEGGGTEFPLLWRNERERWCEWIECNGDAGDDEGRGVVFKPVAGNAVYWENFRPDGRRKGWDETWHAGLPVRKGMKVGLNIWSWGRLD